MKYKGFLLATAGGLAVAPGAQAADLAVKAPLLMPPPASWTGWYIGANLGAAWQNMNAANGDNTAYNCGVSCGHIDGSSFIGGGQIGYNWQHGNSVFGLEGDISGFSNGPSWSGSGGGSSSRYGISTKANWLSTLRGRIGLAVTDTMVYATGGLAIGGVHNSHDFVGETGGSSVKSETKTKVGWVVGGGVEHMWDAHWTIGLEGLFVDLGKSSVTVNQFGANNGKTTTFTNQIVIGRVKVNYKF